MKQKFLVSLIISIVGMSIYSIGYTAKSNDKAPSSCVLRDCKAELDSAKQKCSDYACVQKAEQNESMCNMANEVCKKGH